MSSEPAATLAACPGCAVGAVARDAAEKAGSGERRDLILSVPSMHCAGCMATVERTLEALPSVRSARVNLTLRRALVETNGTAEAAPLIAALAGAGYEAHELDPAEIASTAQDREGRDLLMRLGVAGFAMMNVMLLSVAVWSGAAEATRDMFHWISALIALPTIAFSGRPFFANAFRALRAARLNMDVPISLALVLAAGMSLYETMQSGAHAYFDAALSLTFFLLAGRYLDHRTRHAARSAAAELTALEVPRALLVDGTRVAVADIRPGDRVRVLPGARMPVDGIVAAGESELDRSLLTGETMPAAIAPGMAVSAGEINLTGPLEISVTSSGTDTSLKRLADLVTTAESARNRYTSLADRAARIYAPAVHLLALAAFLGWLLASGDLRLSLNIAVAVLIITCPCALGLAVPAVSAAASGRLYREGILIKSATALERLAEVDTVVFDKTGTLTAGQPVLASCDEADDAALSVALSLARASAHPLSAALAAALEGQGVAAAPVEGVTEVPGHGVEGRLEGRTVRLGRPDWVGAGAVPGLSAALSTGDGTHLFRFTDALRPGAAEAVAGLRARGLDVILLSGDTAPNVAAIADELGIEAWEAGQLPADKAARIGALARGGRKVLMIGDGLNDTAALAAAHVSISPATALDAARVVADMVLIGTSLAPVATAISVAGRATRRIKENFALAAGYNAIAVPLAVAGLATPLAAALAMSASSITVSLNAMRLQRK